MLLTISPTFLPSIKSGGPAISLSRVASLFNEKNSVFLTSNLDLDGSSYRPEDIEDVKRKYKNVRYINYHNYIFLVTRYAFSKNFKSLYINTFFSISYCFLPIIIFKLISPSTRIILAPRGQLESGALEMKNRKKMIFIKFFKLLVNFNSINMHFTSINEKEEFEKIESKVNDNNIFIVPNLPPINIPNPSLIKKIVRPDHFCFISRIVPKKNLKFLLKSLQKVNNKCVLDVYGPIEDKKYWKDCTQIIDTLNSNIKVNYKGVVERLDIYDVLSKYSYFLFPTASENFGHVILESLLSFTPVIVSNKTPWKTSACKSIQAIDLDLDKWSNEINMILNKTHFNSYTHKKNVNLFIINYLRNDQSAQNTLKMLLN